MGGDTIVRVRTAWLEMELRDSVRAAGGRWDPARRQWELRYDRAGVLGLEDRIIRELDN